MLQLKKLLFVVNVDWFFVSHRLPIALKAISDGYDVHLACKFSDKKSYLQSLSITCHDIPFSRAGASLLNEVNSIFILQRLIKFNKFDIVHAVTIKPVIYSGLVLQTINRDIAFVAAISGLGYVFTNNSLSVKITRMFVSFLYYLSLRYERKIVIFQNSTDQKILSRFVKLSSSNTLIIKGSGVDLSVYTYCTEPNSTKKIVTIACRLLKEKGIYEFIQAAKVVRGLYSNVEFWLIGDIDLHNPSSVSQEEINSWESQGIIKAFGHRDDIPQLFARSHIITLPSFYGEGVPKVLIEAAASGRPIVTTNNPGCSDAIIDGETGLLVPIKDSQALANAILDLLTSDAKRLLMGVKGRDFAVQEFDVKNVVKKHLDVYESLVSY